jgi:membrane protease YdiL (CAAX protease family)
MGDSPDTRGTVEPTPSPRRATTLLCRALAGYLAVVAVIAFANRFSLNARVTISVAALLAAPLIFGPARWRARMLRPRWKRIVPGVAEALLVSAVVLTVFLAVVWRAGYLNPAAPSPGTLALGAAQMLFGVALPEEFFFRGYLQRVLTVMVPLRRKVLGARCGIGLPLAAALFALAHLAGGGGVRMLLVFFPGLLFGWLYARRRSVSGPAVCHAACNLSLTACQALF